jgi:hypothetical protein
MPQAKNPLNPLDVMVITRERLQDALDEAVRRGRMTRDDASELLSEILRRAISAPADRVIREVKRVAGTGEDEFPIADYDELTAAQIVARLGDLELPELRRVRDYERRNANRKTVLAALDQKLA